MGRLLRVELFSEIDSADSISCADRNSTDFKSYKGHHVLGLSDSYFTSIVGPNGSGKSNSYANRMAMTQETPVANEM